MSATVETDVVVDGHCTTGCGVATALDFALALVKPLCGAEIAAQVQNALR